MSDGQLKRNATLNPSNADNDDFTSHAWLVFEVARVIGWFFKMNIVIEYDVRLADWIR